MPKCVHLQTYLRTYKLYIMLYISHLFPVPSGATFPHFCRGACFYRRPEKRPSAYVVCDVGGTELLVPAAVGLSRVGNLLGMLGRSCHVKQQFEIAK